MSSNKFIGDLSRYSNLREDMNYLIKNNKVSTKTNLDRLYQLNKLLLWLERKVISEKEYDLIKIPK